MLKPVYDIFFPFIKTMHFQKRLFDFWFFRSHLSFYGPCIYMEMKNIRWPTSGRLETKMSGVYDWEVRWCCWLLLVRLLLFIPVRCWNQSQQRSYITCCLHSPPQSPLQLQTPKLRSVPPFSRPRLVLFKHLLYGRPIGFFILSSVHFAPPFPFFPVQCAVVILSISWL